MSKKIAQCLNGFVADWMEYKKLRRFAGKAWRKLWEFRTRITVHHNTERGCIYREAVPAFHSAFDDFSGLGSDVIIVEKYCQNFKAGSDRVSVSPCSNTTCPYYMAHCEYVDAAAAYDQAMQKRREFWGNTKTEQK